MIGLFDSGYGGLTVLKPILKALPEYDYIYLGDNARAPYGSHSPDNIKKFSEQAVRYLLDRGAKLIIFACNTASSVALRDIQKKYSKVLGVLIPVAEEASKVTKGGRVGVIGTNATINSHAYETEIHKLNPGIHVYSKACPLLVPFIEEGWHEKPEANSIAKKYLQSLKTCHIDTLILGCTHYPMMIKTFRRIMCPRVKILESGDIVATKLKEYLNRHPEIEKTLKKGKKRTFLTTDDPQRFKEFTEKYLGLKIAPTKISLE
ncbi:MAG: glutamate racemase [Candidatus Gracilibacteria bacterium]